MNVVKRHSVDIPHACGSPWKFYTAAGKFTLFLFWSPATICEDDEGVVQQHLRITDMIAWSL